MRKGTKKTKSVLPSRQSEKAVRLKKREAKAAKSSSATASAQRGRSRKPTGPRAQALPIPGGVGRRIQALDDCAAALGEIRDEMAELRAQEKDQMSTALKIMRERDRTTWRHAGIEMSRVAGEEKLRVRKSKEQATASVESDLPSDAVGQQAEPETTRGEGEDAATDHNEEPPQQTLEDSVREGIH